MPLLFVGEVSQPGGELTPLSCHTHNMKGGPLNVMEVVGRSRSPYEWKVNSYKIESCPIFFAVFAIFGHAPGEMIFADFCTDIRGFWSVHLPLVFNKTQQLKRIS